MGTIVDERFGLADRRLDGCAKEGIVVFLDGKSVGSLEGLLDGILVSVADEVYEGAGDGIATNVGLLVETDFLYGMLSSPFALFSFSLIFPERGGAATSLGNFPFLFCPGCSFPFTSSFENGYLSSDVAYPT